MYSEQTQRSPGKAKITKLGVQQWNVSLSKLTYLLEGKNQYSSEKLNRIHSLYEVSFMMSRIQSRITRYIKIFKYRIQINNFVIGKLKVPSHLSFPTTDRTISGHQYWQG